MPRPQDDRDWHDYVVRLGQQLQRERLTRDLTQDDVAYRARLSRYTYQKYEKGESRPGAPANPSIRSLMAIAQTLGLELVDLLPDHPPDLTAR